MKTFKLASLTSALALGVGLAAAPASADVFVNGTVTKDKDVIVDINISKDKDVVIDATFDEELTSAAEAFAINNQVSERNRVERSDRAPSENNGFFDFAINLRATLVDSVRNNLGVLGLNQDAGNVNNQGNVVATAIIQQGSEEPAGSFTHAEASTEQRSNDSSMDHNGSLDFENPDKASRIHGSVSNNSGIVAINQATGNGLNQSNNIALSAGIGSVLALSEADLGQESTGNTVEEVNTVKVDAIRGSGNGNVGVSSGNQSTGNFNNQANTVAFSALVSSAEVGVPGS